MGSYRWNCSNRYRFGGWYVYRDRDRRQWMYRYPLLPHYPAGCSVERHGGCYRRNRFWFEQWVGYRHPGRWNFTLQLCLDSFRRNRGNGYRFGGGHLYRDHHRRQRMHHHRYGNSNPADGSGGNGFFANQRILQRR